MAYAWEYTSHCAPGEAIIDTNSTWSFLSLVMRNQRRTGQGWYGSSPNHEEPRFCLVFILSSSFSYLHNRCWDSSHHIHVSDRKKEEWQKAKGTDCLNQLPLHCFSETLETHLVSSIYTSLVITIFHPHSYLRSEDRKGILLIPN